MTLPEHQFGDDASVYTTQERELLENVSRKAADWLGFDDRTLAAILLVDIPSALAFRTRHPDRSDSNVAFTVGSYDRMVSLVELFRTLSTLFGTGDDEDRPLRWLHGTNTAFGRSPIEEIHNGGLDNVLSYLRAAAN